MKNHCVMHNPSDFRHANQFICDEVFNQAAAYNIALPYHAVRSTNGKLVNQPLDFSSCRSASGYKNNMLRCFRNHPSCPTSTKTASTPDQDVCGIRAKQFVFPSRRSCLAYVS